MICTKGEASWHCPESTLYTSCAPSCPKVCKLYKGTPCDCKGVTTAHCEEGCICPEGSALKDELECISIESPECGGLQDPV